MGEVSSAIPPPLVAGLFALLLSLLLFLSLLLLLLLTMLLLMRLLLVDVKTQRSRALIEVCCITVWTVVRWRERSVRGTGRTQSGQRGDSRGEPT